MGKGFYVNDSAVILESDFQWLILMLRDFLLNKNTEIEIASKISGETKNDQT